MYDQYMGVIKALGFQFVPETWGYCGGGLVSINQFSALFSLLGCAFGGDCRVSFALPDLRGRSPMGFGTGPGLTTRFMGQQVGWWEHPLHNAHMASHSHSHTYSGGGGGPANELSIHVAKAGGKKQLPDNGDYIGAPGNALGIPQDNLFIAAVDVPEGLQASIGGVSSSGGEFNNALLSIDPTPPASQYVNITQPSIAVNYCICMEGLYPSRS